MKVMETERLLIRHFEPGDLDAIYAAVYSDPEVCRFFCRTTRPIEQVREWIPFRSYQSRHEEFGLMAVVVKQTGTLIGLCGIQPYYEPSQVLASEAHRPYVLVEVELTYAFGKQFWGQGYAQEACRAMIAYAFEDVRLGRLVTGCDPENHRAARLQDSLGMRKERNVHPDAAPGELVGILDNPLFAATAGSG
jgi:[ribosomal protein S5]-alanine N-acetyltransferase